MRESLLLMETLRAYLSGAMMMAFAIAGLMFLKYWKRTRDSLFLSFAASFFLLALERISLIVINPYEEARIYLLRLLAYVSLGVAIIVKNRPRRT